MDELRVPKSVEVCHLEPPVLRNGDTLMFTNVVTFSGGGEMCCETGREAWIQRSDDALECYPEAF